MIYVECLVFPLHATSYVVGTIRTFILYEYKIKYLNLGWGASVLTLTFPVQLKAALHPALKKRELAVHSFCLFDCRGLLKNCVGCQQSPEYFQASFQCFKTT